MGAAASRDAAHCDLQEAARLSGAVERLPRTYIYCQRSGPGDMFAQFAKRAQCEPEWNYCARRQP